MDARELTTKEHPKGLREIPEPPPSLWLRGELAPKGHKTLAVVGSRALSSYGREAITHFISGLKGYPISIVSGIALGADAAAHQAALAYGLHTVAVLGSGLDDSVLSPKTNLGIAHDILAAGGGLLSEHPPLYVPRPYDFPSRNRIVVGMADAVLIIEAGERSGTLITARLAAEYNRELLCVPHRIGDPHGFGSHLFLRLGATLATHPLHLLEALQIPPIFTESTQTLLLEGNEKTVYDLLSAPTRRDKLVKASGLTVDDTLTALVTLELKGVAREEHGLWKRV